MTRFTNGVPIARGKCGQSCGQSDNQEANWRTEAEIANEKFIAAHRRYELRLADRIEAEMCGGITPQAKAVVIETELASAILTKHERELLAIANGASIRVEAPMPRRTDSAYTLAGAPAELW